MFHKRRSRGGEKSSWEKLRHVQGREVREQGLFRKPDPPLYDRRPGLVCESGAVSTWKFEHQPEGEGDLLAFFFLKAIWTWFLDYHSGRNRKDGLEGEEAKGISSSYYFKFLAASCIMWDLSSLTKDRTLIPCIGRQNLNHWTSREVPRLEKLKPAI